MRNENHKYTLVGLSLIHIFNRIYYYMRNGHNGVNGDYLDAASDDALSVISSESDVYKPVSYTHLDVYKRQGLSWSAALMQEYGVGTNILEDMEWAAYWTRPYNLSLIHI